MTFKEFLKSGLKNNLFGDTPEADFANDALRDSSFRHFTEWTELETYLLFHGGDQAVLKAAKSCFRKWRAAHA